MISVEDLRLLRHVLFHRVSVLDRLIIDIRIPLRDKLANTACQIRIMSMMKIVRFSAFRERRRFAQVVRHARLDRHDLRLRIPDAQQQLREFHHLARLDQLASYKPPHSVLAHIRAHEILELLVPYQPGIVQRPPIARHTLTSLLVNEHRIGLALIFLPIHQRLVLEAVILDIRTRNDVINFIKARV